MTAGHARIGSRASSRQQAAARQVEQVLPFDVVELQCASDGVQHAFGGSVDVSTLEPGVVVETDPGEHRDLFAPKPRHSALATEVLHACSRGVMLARREMRNSRDSSLWLMTSNLRRLTAQVGRSSDTPAHAPPGRLAYGTPGRPVRASTWYRWSSMAIGAFRIAPSKDSGEEMLTVNAYAAPSATDPLIPTTIERRDLRPHGVLIDIAYAGICHSDIHTVRGDWGEITYPQVVGHEIVGVVREIGSAVTKHKVGDRVGVGCESGLLRPVRAVPEGTGGVLPQRQHPDL